MSNPTVAQIMTTAELVVCRPSDSTAHAARAMARAGVRHLPVVDAERKVIGVVSRRDLTGAGEEARVAEVMSPAVNTVAAETAASEAAYLLWQRELECVPVTAPGGELIGLVTESDFVRLAYTLLGGRAPVDDLIAEEHEAERS